MNIRRLVEGGEGEEGACETIEYGEEQGGGGGGWRSQLLSFINI